jgi:prepilin-type N-terminal cleavage/methylation domain-containing protein
MHRRSTTSRSSRAGFALVEIMIVIGIMAIVVAIAVPGWIRQRSLSQQRSCQENLSKIDGAKEQWALETRQAPDAVPTLNDLYAEGGELFLKTLPRCPTNGTYRLNAVGADAACSITAAPYNHNAVPFADVDGGN